MLSLFLKRKLHIKVIEVIPLFVFFFLCLTRSLSFIIHLFYFISFILSFILFHFIIKIYIYIYIYIFLFFYFLYIFFSSFSSSLFFIFNFPRGWRNCFAVCRSLFSPFIFLSSFLLFLPSNPSSSYTYPNSILRLT